MGFVDNNWDFLMLYFLAFNYAQALWPLSTISSSIKLDLSFKIAVYPKVDVLKLNVE